MLTEIAACVPILLLLKYILKKDPAPKSGIYYEQGKWFHLKKWWMYWLTYFWFKRSKRSGELKGSADHDRVKDAFVSFDKPAFSDQDKPWTDLSNEQKTDSMYINGQNSEGSCFVLRIIRKVDRKAEIWLTINIPGIGNLQHPVHPDTLVYNTDGRSFSAGGLTFTNLEPMTRWRITFNGLLRNSISSVLQTENKSLLHVKCSFIWEACGDVFDLNEDVHPMALSEAVAREPWKEKCWSDLHRLYGGLRADRYSEYEQTGELHGVVTVEGYEEKILYLRGFRNHTFGIKDLNDYHRCIDHYCILENGHAFHVSSSSIPGYLSHLKSGYVAYPVGQNVSIKDNGIEFPTLGENHNPPDKYAFSFTADAKEYLVQVYSNNTAVYYHGDNWGTVVYSKMADFRVNGIKGFGVAEFSYKNDGGRLVPLQTSYPLVSENSQVSPADADELALPFTKSACGSPLVVGGKGCQLADLTKLQSQLNCVVPAGFCLTIQSFELQLQKNVDLGSYLDEVENAVREGKTDGLQDACQSACLAIASSPLCQEIQQAIASNLIRVFDSRHDDLAFAVRSSAAGEDSAEMSAAGQMDTILGVRGIHKIFEAVAKCWASQYTFQAVQYRRQHGQPIKSQMGVVIQEMVKSQASGVLFTCDPVTGNPGVMSIDANYGLGESVVSGIADPDVIQLQRSWDDGVTILKKSIGKKKISITMQDDGGTVEEEIKEQEASKCCLSDSLILRLAHVGIELEKHFADARDIEWAVCDDTIYLLQARPITTLDMETEWELMHEFDTPLRSDREWLTTCNIGEMMPGALSPLTFSTFLKAVEYSMQYFQHKVGVRSSVQGYHKVMGSCCGHAFINMHNIHAFQKSALGDKRMADLALTGRVLEDLTIDELNQYLGQDPWLTRIISAYKNITSLYKTKGIVQNWESFINTYTLLNKETAKDIYADIDENLHFGYQCWADTVMLSAASGSWSSILMAIITQGKPDWKTEHYSDVAVLLSHCPDVYSADVPAALQNLAEVIHKNGYGPEFATMSTQEAVSWIQSDVSGDAGTQYLSFLSRHGHRCVRESEFLEKSWRSDPTKFVSVLQTILKNWKAGSSVSTKKQLSAEEAVAKVKSPLTFIGRKILKMVLPKARSAVADREWGKSLSIKMWDVYKQAYWKLADKMVQEGWLPDMELLFFLTHREIGQILKNRSARLITKAAKRQRILQKQKMLSFPEMSIGHPKQIEETEEEDFVITSLRLKGMPVSQGLAKGTARVVTSLQAASSIQAGDILIVQYTDVGWSPYFTLISGLVTELGGLVSHGAVVAREYGIPCVVNVHNATTMFKSGDQVVLDGTSGVIEKTE